MSSFTRARVCFGAGFSPRSIVARGAGLFAVAVLACGLANAGVDEFAIKNAGFMRTISAFGGPLRTTKIEVERTQLLQQPGVEFMIDVDFKGEPVTLTPANFEIRDIDTVKDGKELRTILRLQCLHDGIPLIVNLRYHRDPQALYQQKSIVLLPCPEAPGAVLRRVTLEDMGLKPEFAPMESLAAYDQNSRRGVFCFVTSLFGREAIGRGGALRMWEDVYIPLARGYETGRATIGVVSGPPELLLERFREFVWESHCVGRGKTVLVGENKPVALPRADVLAGKLPGNAVAVELSGDEWRAASAYIKEPEFSDLVACRDACRKLRQANRDLVISLAPGSMPPTEQIHWLAAVDRITLSPEPVEGSKGALPAGTGAEAGSPVFPPRALGRSGP